IVARAAGEYLPQNGIYGATFCQSDLAGMVEKQRVWQGGIGCGRLGAGDLREYVDDGGPLKGCHARRCDHSKTKHTAKDGPAPMALLFKRRIVFRSGCRWFGCFRASPEYSVLN